MMYLKGLLSDEPQALVKNLKTTNANFNMAWKLLEERYQNTNKLFKAHFDAILEIPIMKNETAVAVKQLMDTTKASLAAIDSLLPLRSQSDPFLCIY